MEVADNALQPRWCIFSNIFADAEFRLYINDENAYVLIRYEEEEKQFVQ